MKTLTGPLKGNFPLTADKLVLERMHRMTLTTMQRIAKTDNAGRIRMRQRSLAKLRRVSNQYLHELNLEYGHISNGALYRLSLPIVPHFGLRVLLLLEPPAQCPLYINYPLTGRRPKDVRVYYRHVYR